VRNATAWGNTPGNPPTNPEALKARHDAVLCSAQVLIPPLQRFDHNSTVDLGRWPRLLHHAPLALNAAAVLTVYRAAKPLKRIERKPINKSPG
jgi:hypothetical protein